MSIRTDLTHDEYDALPGWRWSHIKLLENGSPLAVQHAQTAPSEDTTSRVKLRAIHAAVLEPDRFDAMFAVYEGERRAGKAWEAFLAENGDRSILKSSEYDEVQHTAESIRRHPMVRELMSDGSPEVSVSWTDPETGLSCKGRVDWLGSAGILDLKTCGTVHERAVASTVVRNLWHGQLAHYASGLTAHGAAPRAAYIIAAEGKGAQDVAVYQLDRGIPDGALYVGDGLRSRLMRQLAECVSLNHWPGRHPEIVPLCLPTYALDDVEITGADAVTV